MKIFLVLSGLPYNRGEAIEVVSYEIVRIMASAGHKLAVLTIIREGCSEKIEKLFKYVKRSFENDDKIQLLPIIYLADMLPDNSRWKKLFEYGCAVINSFPLLRNRINPFFFPAMAVQNNVHNLVYKYRPDIILSIWSWEALSATFDITDFPKFVYYGNPNHKPPEAQMRFPELFDINKQGILNKFRLMIYKLFNRAREIQHLKMMSHCEVTANNSLVDSEYYKEAGHPRSIYLQNMWPESSNGPIFGGKPDPEGPLKIVGSVGNLGATGNTFGLYYLGKKIAPILEDKVKKPGLLINVYGKGTPRKKVSEALRRDTIHLCGWVDDLNEEIHRSHCFLVLTNVDGFIVGNTRILLAWSLGACVVGHSNSALSMPEINHMKNALLGDTPDEIAALIFDVYQDRDLRQRIGRGGYDTYQEYYKSTRVIPEMIEAMKECVSNYQKDFS